MSFLFEYVRFQLEVRRTSASATHLTEQAIKPFRTRPFILAALRLCVRLIYQRPWMRGSMASRMPSPM